MLHTAALQLAALGCRELKALTSLQLNGDLEDLPASASQLTALRQLEVQTATATALSRLHVLYDLTRLCVWDMIGAPSESPPLQLPGLQHLQLRCHLNPIMPKLFLASSTRLQFLMLSGFQLKGPGSLVASTMLQHLELYNCSIAAADGAADPVSWQQVFPGPGRLPHLTCLQLFDEVPPLQQADIEVVVACCSNLKAFCRDTSPSSFMPVLARLPGLTSLQLHYAGDEQCSAMAQLTGLRQLKLTVPSQVSVVGLRQLAALQQLTSFGMWLRNFKCIKLVMLADHLMRDKLKGQGMFDCNQVCVNLQFHCCRCVVLYQWLKLWWGGGPWGWAGTRKLSRH